MRKLGLVATLMLVSTPALAYVDPGVLAVLFQMGYALLFGAFAFFILRPWNYLKGLARSIFKRSADGQQQAKKH